MLSSVDIHKEIEIAEETTKNSSVAEIATVKLLTLVIKLLHNIRTNQTEIMKKQGIELKEPKTREKTDDGKEKPKA